MGNIIDKIGLSKFEILRNPWVLSGIIAGAIVVFVLLLIILRRRKFKKVINVILTDNKEGDDRRPGDNYGPIVKRIKQVKRKYKSILFTSVEPGILPVTIPVNVAITLAKARKRCLLIDLDFKRDAIAHVFGLADEQGGLRAKAVQTEIENLWVWPSHNFSQAKLMNVAEIVEKALDNKFNFILINAPSIINSPDRKQIISAARAVFICTKNPAEKKKLIELIKPLDCTIIGHLQAS
ncbi:MAG: hypothetical protein PHY02_10250 [Phycisphaerae bacterium]|nr:hypothetical protein [Phycisphaerae bacterium]